MRYTGTMTPAALLTDLIALTTALEADGATDTRRRQQRDRAIGKELHGQRKRPARQLSGWLRRVDIADWRPSGAHAGVHLYRVLGVSLAVLGLAVGWTLARGVLSYSGQTPINIFHVVSALVLPQILLLVVWLLLALPGASALFSGVRATLGVVHPGRLAQRFAARLERGRTPGLQLLWTQHQSRVMTPAGRWLVSYWSQLFAVWFNVGALLALAYLTAFSDLAFAWSTTLNLDNAEFHRLLQWLSWPWHNLYPQAVPSRELIDASRFYRLQSGGFEPAPPLSAAQLGAWWPFLFLALTSYGLLPRLVTLLVSWLRLRVHLARALAHIAGAAELLARMNSPLVTTVCAHDDVIAGAPGANADASDPVPSARTDGVAMACPVVGWSGTYAQRERLAPRLRGLGIEPLDWQDAGGGRSLHEDRTLVASLCQKRQSGVAVVVRAWEPPLLDFIDFLRDLRRQCGARQAIVVALWGGEHPVATRDSEVWRHALRQLHDPYLHVETLEPTP